MRPELGARLRLEVGLGIGDSGDGQRRVQRLDGGVFHDSFGGRVGSQVPSLGSADLSPGLAVVCNEIPLFADALDVCWTSGSAPSGTSALRPIRARTRHAAAKPPRRPD